MNIKILIERIVFTLPFSLVFCTAVSQENYLPGYVIKPGGDTLQGFIDYRNWERCPNKIYFKEQPGVDRSGFTPVDIREFGVLDEIYKSAIVETEISPVNTNELQYSKGLTIKTDTAFLQTIIKGAKSLYFYMNKFGKEQFYIRKDTTFELLIYKKYLQEQEQEGQTVIAENKKYVGQLTIYLYNCPEIQQKTKDLEYRKNSMENLFLFYYRCVPSEITFHKKTKKISTEFGVLAGMTLTSLKFKGTGFGYLVNADYDLSANFSAGLFADVILAGNQGKWSLCNELIFTSYKVNGRVDDYVHEDNYTIINTTIGYSYLKLINMLRFKYPAGKLFIYLNAGISNGYAVTEKNYKKTEKKFFSTETVEEGKALDDTRKYEFGFISGLGTKFRKLSFEIRYEWGNGMSEYTELTSSTNRFYFLLGYRF
jgi:hypothetical protein